MLNPNTEIMNYENLLELPSVGCVIDSETGIVYPLFENGDIDLDMGVEFDEASDEWLESLSENDINLLIEKGIFKILN